MNIEEQIRTKLQSLKVTAKKSNDVRDVGVELTVCQLIVVLISFVSIAFLFVPLLFLKNPIFMVLLFIGDVLLLLSGIWFWLHKADICENPEVQE